MISVAGLICACVLSAAPEQAGDRELRPGRDLFGTAGPRPERLPGRASVWGTVQLSDGTRIEGRVSLAPGRPLEVYDIDAKEWRELALAGLLELRAAVRSEKLEREWRWKEYGKDVKVYTGRAYPRRWLDHEAVLADGRRLRCHVRGAVLHVATESEPVEYDQAGPEKKESEHEKHGARELDEKGPSRGRTEPERPAETPKRRRFILRQYERGRLGQTLDDLVYVKRVLVHEKGRAPVPAGEAEVREVEAREDGTRGPAAGPEKSAPDAE